jgi:predicted alpha/beta superfamily hydrolase
MSHVHIIRDFYSYPESLTRTVRIYTPDAYDSQTEARFPVLFMLDGQNAFNHPESAIFNTWCANTAMDTLAAEGALQPWIIVGIDHTAGRMEEYSLWPDQAQGTDGKGEAFIDFLVNHLKPYIDQTYRTRTQPCWTAVLGASMGGLMALILGKRQPDVFGRIGAVSPTVMWAGGAVFGLWDGPTDRWLRLYMDTGDLEKYWFYDVFLDYVETTRNFFDHLKAVGVEDHELRYVVAQGHFHNEEAWQQRLPGILRWLLTDEGAPEPTPQ